MSLIIIRSNIKFLFHNLIHLKLVLDDNYQINLKIFHKIIIIFSTFLIKITLKPFYYILFLNFNINY